MARMDTRMPLMVQQPDFVNALARSSQAAAQTNAVQDQNALRQLYRTQGADIAAGNPGAINALAGLDPMAALGVQDARQGMAARAELMEQRRVAAKRQTAEYAATLDAREQAELAKRMEAGIARGIGMYQAGDLPGLNELLVGIGEEPIQSLDEFPAIAALYGDSLGKLKEVMAINAPPKAADEYERYVREEEAAGRQPLDRIGFHKAKQRSSSIEMGPDGTVRITEGGAAAQKPFTEGQSKDNVYSTRARGALQILEPVAGNLSNRGERIADMVPLGIGREFQSEDFQVAQQAGTEFLQAILRKDTGAAITQQEEDSYGRVYLPQPGDGPAVKEAKRQARVRAVNAIEAGMSPQQMLVRDRALINTARESGQQVKEREAGGPDVPEQPPEFLNPSDLELWQYMTPLERQAILGDYEGQQ